MANNSMGNTETYEFPNFEETPEELKGKPDYSIKVAKTIIDKYHKGRTATSESWCSFWDTLRLYGLGRQPSSLYKTFLSSATATNVNDGTDSDIQVDVRGQARER